MSQLVNTNSDIWRPRLKTPTAFWRLSYDSCSAVLSLSSIACICGYSEVRCLLFEWKHDLFIFIAKLRSRFHNQAPCLKPSKWHNFRQAPIAVFIPVTNCWRAACDLLGRNFHLLTSSFRKTRFYSTNWLFHSWTSSYGGGVSCNSSATRTDVEDCKEINTEVDSEVQFEPDHSLSRWIGYNTEKSLLRIRHFSNPLNRYLNEHTAVASLKGQRMISRASTRKVPIDTPAYSFCHLITVFWIGSGHKCRSSHTKTLRFRFPETGFVHEAATPAEREVWKKGRGVSEHPCCAVSIQDHLILSRRPMGDSVRAFLEISGS